MTIEKFWSTEDRKVDMGTFKKNTHNFFLGCCVRIIYNNLFIIYIYIYIYKLISLYVCVWEGAFFPIKKKSEGASARGAEEGGAHNNNKTQSKNNKKHTHTQPE